MKKVLLFGAMALLLVGCQSPYENAGVGSYGYTYDLNLPPTVGSPGALHALQTTAISPAYTVVTEPAAAAPALPAAQSVTFYEGAQPANVAIAGVTPVWTPPTGVSAAPGAVPTGAPTVNEAAGAAVGGGAAGVGAGAAVPQGAAYGGGYYGDGGVTIIGSNGLPTSTSNVFVPTNITITNIVSTNGGTNIVTNAVPMTNSFGGITNTNGGIVLTNFSGGPSNFALTNNPAATAPTGTAVAGATNNLNNLPRASAPTAGTPPGTQLVPNRPIGEPAGAQISPSPAVPAGSVTPTTPPTQPGPTSTGTSSTGTTGSSTSGSTGNAQTVIGGASGVQQNTATGVVTPNASPTTSSASANAVQQQQQRQLLLNQQRAAQQRQQAAPAAAPTAPTAPSAPSATPK